ncbi:MAG: hypothetical protein GY814_20160, partial [Gammaproteobacteria bacterium]|nr:hypothetical protein [Gammaproteobacteria bacterium]
MATALLTGYGGRKAYAACTQVVGQPAGTFTCSSATNATQSPSGTPLTVTTDSSFSITTTGNAFTLSGTDGLTFTHGNASTITGGASGIRAYNYGSGELSITSTTGAVVGTAGFGIYAYNHNTNSTNLTIVTAAVTGHYFGIAAKNKGTGELSITSTGAVEGTTGYGIYARSDGTNLTIDTKAAVTGGEDAINAY